MKFVTTNDGYRIEYNGNVCKVTEITPFFSGQSITVTRNLLLLLQDIMGLEQ
jgi:hypothetical protein